MNYDLQRHQAFKALGRQEDYFDVIIEVLDALVEGRDIRPEDAEFLNRYREIKAMYPKIELEERTAVAVPL